MKIYHSALRAIAASAMIASSLAAYSSVDNNTAGTFADQSAHNAAPSLRGAVRGIERSARRLISAPSAPVIPAHDSLDSTGPLSSNTIGGSAIPDDLRWWIEEPPNSAGECEDDDSFLGNRNQSCEDMNQEDCDEYGIDGETKVKDGCRKTCGECE